MIKKIISKKLERACAVCGGLVKVIIYNNKSYRGGHYFGKITVKSGKEVEYWECPGCYWGKK